jgi:hypothetical protein
MKDYYRTLALFAVSALIGGDLHAAQSPISLAYDLNGTVAASCTFTRTAGQATISLGSIMGAGGMLAVQTTGYNAIGSISCNGAATVSIQTTNGALKNGGGNCSGGASATCVTYNAFLKVGSGTITTLNATGAPPSTAPSQVVAATTDSINLSVGLVGPTTTVLASGTFSDVLTVSVGAN